MPAQKPPLATIVTSTQMEDLVERLGSDRRIAEELDYSAATVSRLRRAYRVQPGRRQQAVPDAAAAVRDDPDKLRDLVATTSSDAEAARQLQVSRATFRNWRVGLHSQLEQPVERPGTVPPIRDVVSEAELRAALALHGTDIAVGEHLGYSETAVSNYRRQLGIESENVVPEAVRVVLSDRVALRELLEEHRSAARVGEVLGVPAETVTDYRNRAELPTFTNGWGKPAPPDAAEALRNGPELLAMIAEHNTEGTARLLGVAGHTVRYWRDKHRRKR